MIRTEDKEKLVYVDETGIDTYLYRERAKRGQKIIGLDENSQGNR